MPTLVRRVTIILIAWLPLFGFWVLSAMSISNASLSAVFLPCLISMGSGGLLGIVVWYLCQRWPWPAHFTARFYVLQVLLAITYALAWTALVFVFESLRLGKAAPGMWTWAGLARECSLGIWLYGMFAGVSYAVQTRDRLHDKETMAARAEALATAARLDALRARLNPHFLFNALHTLDALVKFKPALAEGAIERLGDMLRYTLK